MIALLQEETRRGGKTCCLAFYNSMPLTFGRASSSCLLADKLSTSSSVYPWQLSEGSSSSDAKEVDAAASSTAASLNGDQRASPCEDSSSKMTLSVSACADSRHGIAKALRLGFLRLFRGRLNNSIAASLLLLLVMGILHVMAFAVMAFAMSDPEYRWQPEAFKTCWWRSLASESFMFDVSIISPRRSSHFESGCLEFDWQVLRCFILLRRLKLSFTSSFNTFVGNRFVILGIIVAVWFDCVKCSGGIDGVLCLGFVAVFFNSYVASPGWPIDHARESWMSRSSWGTLTFRIYAMYVGPMLFSLASDLCSFL